MRYRADIDGLRAVAVLAVVDHHAHLSGLRGGFVGVDIFFVISGFLIARQIAERQAAGDWTLAGFYERRARRILPALFTMLAVVTGLALLFLDPTSLQAYARSLAATLLFGSNFYFSINSGYFAQSADLLPLLHTWSLGVEEQFYLIFPLLTLIPWLRRRLALTAALVGLLSFAFSVWAANSHAGVAFYWPVSRAWELMIGVLLAVGPIPALRIGWRREAAVLGGLAMIGLSLLGYSQHMPWPGLPALLPCLGAALVIWSGGDSRASRLLSAPPLVGIGLISYSLYLWHWPVLAFARLTGLGGSDKGTMLALVALSMVLATVSWWGIERPFRRRDRISRRHLLVIGGGMLLVLVLACLAILGAEGLPRRLDARERSLASHGERSVDREYRKGVCFLLGKDKPERLRQNPCLTPDPTRPNWLLVGDSAAAHLWWGLDRAMPQIHVLQVNVGACRMTLNPFPEQWETCREVTRRVYEDILVNRPPEGMILAGRWRSGDLPAIEATLDWARARHLSVVLVGPAPSYRSNLPQLLIQSERMGRPELVRQNLVAGPFELDRAMAALAARKGVAYLSPITTLCPDRRCLTEVSPGVPLQRDQFHLTPEGSVLLAQRWREAGAFRF